MTENINGVFINMNLLTETTINNINNYIKFIKNQENYINIHEEEKESLQSIYFKNKDILLNNNET